MEDKINRLIANYIDRMNWNSIILEEENIREWKQGFYEGNNVALNGVIDDLRMLIQFGMVIE